MRLPETAAGHDAEVREVQGECVHGARPKGANSNRTSEMDGLAQLSGGLRPSFCKANGHWHVLAGSVCECLAGYEPSADSSACTACPVSTYKLRAGAGVCQLCPPNSHTVTVASSVCDCELGYFWHQKQHQEEKKEEEEEKRDFGVCTQYLPTPSGLRVMMRDDTKLLLTWNVLNPHAAVSTSDVVYALRCPTCRKSVVTFIPGYIINGTQ
ncbi:unnamed protein product [Schistocephalus solidus]|uniref:Ephrin_rec_like domain-containing protein n=1 Tax=Schistocephalus solidus TaxID=70667 RepID=A0A183TCS5_SCHSO|nr:unnamed protein product [Schistocephalus solidus]